MTKTTSILLTTIYLLHTCGAAAYSAQTSVPAKKTETRRLVGYFTSWSIYSRKYQVAHIPAEHLTHINYAFANISEDGRCVLGDPQADTRHKFPGDHTSNNINSSVHNNATRGNFHQLRLLKKKHAHLRTLISIGGWTWSGRFSDVALTDRSRKVFAKSCVDFIQKHRFDGVDIDWEYPVTGGKKGNRCRPEDKRNFTLLLAEVRRHLDAAASKQQRRYDLSIAAPAGFSAIANIEISEIRKIVDWINLMTYDYRGSWSRRTGFCSPLFAPREQGKPIAPDLCVDATVKKYLAAGLPPSKLVVGVPFYGRGWKDVDRSAAGFNQPHAGELRASLGYRHIRRDRLNRMTRHWHQDSRVPWLYDPTSKIMISYEDVESLQAKARYTVARKLGGMMIWELSQDTTDESSLVRTISKEFTRE